MAVEFGENVSGVRMDEYLVDSDESVTNANGSENGTCEWCERLHITSVCWVPCLVRNIVPSPRPRYLTGAGIQYWPVRR